jgi:transcriptional regulator with GAF, ATPase, and Fis domain
MYAACSTPDSGGPPSWEATPGAIVTQNEEMLGALSRLRTIAQTEGAVLLIGETGVGKELLAEFVHRESPRRDRPLVKVGLAALPRELLESELFGHEKGAYTHAVCQKRGLFELSDGGTIFLDDIDDFPLELQPKLLRALEAREIMRVGGTTPVRVHSRLVSATKVDLKELVLRHAFRADLYYRINVMPVFIPPLRDRSDDIPLLVAHFSRIFAPGRTLSFTEAACGRMLCHGWPGNVRELRNVIQRLCLFANGKVQENDLPPEMLSGCDAGELPRRCDQCRVRDDLSFDNVVACVERHLIEQALAEAGGNQSQAARALRMNLSTFRDKLHKYSLPQTA